MFNRQGANEFAQFLDLVKDPTKAKTTLDGLMQESERAERLKAEAAQEMKVLLAARTENQQQAAANSRRAAVLDRRERDLESMQSLIVANEDRLKGRLSNVEEMENDVTQRINEVIEREQQVADREKAADRRMQEANVIKAEAQRKIANLKAQLA
jgi:hypothetical protein